MDFTDLFAGHLLVFTVPILLSIIIWSFALLGFLEMQMLDIDLDHDVHLDSGGLPGWMDVFHTLGVGMVPLSLLVTVFLFAFGWAGLSVKLFLETDPGTTLLYGIPLGIGVGLVAAAGGARLLRPVFKEYGKAHDANTFVGKVASLTSTKLNPHFGTANLKLESGVVIKLSVRTDMEVTEVKPGQKLLLLEYREAQNVYIVEPFDPDSPIS